MATHDSGPARGTDRSLAQLERFAEHRDMEVAGGRPQRLLPLRIVAALLLIADGFGIARIVADRHELLAQHPAASQKLLATLIAVSFFGAVALAFLAFWRQRFGLWIVLAATAIQLALETWAGFSPLWLSRLPASAAIVFLLARRAWPDLRRVA
jgi:hypothetical protein